MSQFIAGAVAGGAVAAVVGTLVLFPLGMHIGARDERLLQLADRAAAVSLCTEGERAVLLVGTRPQDDVWLCAAGSGRLLPRAPLSDPLGEWAGR